MRRADDEIVVSSLSGHVQNRRTLSSRPPSSLASPAVPHARRARVGISISARRILSALGCSRAFTRGGVRFSEATITP